MKLSPLPGERQIVAQTSKSAVSQASKPATATALYNLPIWKSAIQQVWKPALRKADFTENSEERPESMELTENEPLTSRNPSKLTKAGQTQSK